jgi:serine/threonine protein kinase
VPERETGAGAGLVAARYRLVRELGRGGMGVVWLAEDQLTGRQVAVKEVRPPQGLSLDDKKVYGQRALREARNAARIDHPGAVTLYDVVPASDADDAVYLIMELVGGPTLAQLIRRRGRLPEAEVAGIGLQLVSVLEAAHRLGIVHRDIKPANIIITAGGHARLTDFSIAHAVGDTRLTVTGVIGTQAYMAPELFESAPITPAADVWSLGATIYAAADGTGPFERDSTAATLRAILVEDPPVPGCSAGLAAVIAQMLCPDPARRATLGQARDGLLPVAAGQHNAQDRAALHPPAPAAAALPVPAPGTVAAPPAPPQTPNTGPPSALATPAGPVPGDTRKIVPAASPPASQPDPSQPAPTTPTQPAPPASPPDAPPGPSAPRRPRRGLLAAAAAAVVIATAVALPLLLSGTHTTPPRPTAANAPAHTHSASKSPAPTKQVVQTLPTHVHLRLVVTAGNMTYAELTTSSGRVLFQGDVTGGTQKSWTENHEITLALGNPGGATLYLNGKKMPFSETTRPITVVCTPTTCTTS